MRRVLGQPGGAMVSVAAMISIFAALNGSILSGSRVPYAMATRRIIFSSRQPRESQRSALQGAIMLLGVWSSLLLLSGQYQATLYAGDLSQLDFVWNDGRLRHCFATEDGLIWTARTESPVIPWYQYCSFLSPVPCFIPLSDLLRGNPASVWR